REAHQRHGVVTEIADRRDAKPTAARLALGFRHLLAATPVADLVAVAHVAVAAARAVGIDLAGRGAAVARRGVAVVAGVARRRGGDAVTADGGGNGGSGRRRGGDRGRGRRARPGGRGRRRDGRGRRARRAGGGRGSGGGRHGGRRDARRGRGRDGFECWNTELTAGAQRATGRPGPGAGGRSVPPDGRHGTAAGATQ